MSLLLCLCIGCLGIVSIDAYYSNYDYYGGNYGGGYGNNNGKYWGGSGSVPGMKRGDLYRGIFGNAYGQYGYGNMYGRYKGVQHCEINDDCNNFNCPLYKPNAYCHAGADGYIKACHCHKQAECNSHQDCEDMAYCSTDETSKCVVDSSNANHNYCKCVGFK